MLPGNLISKFKSRIRSYLGPQDEEEIDSRPYLHSRRRYLINSIPLLSIVALLIGGLASIVSSNSCYAVDASASLIIDDITSDSIGEEELTETVEAVAPGSTAYGKPHKITVKADGISDYDLIITTSTPEITGSSGGKLVSGNAVDDNTWGYKWSTDAAATGDYQAINGQNLKDEDAIINNGVDITRYLTFAAKFGKDNTNAGRYSAEVNLNLALTPAGIIRTLNYDMNSGSGNIPDSTCMDDGDGCIIAVNYTTIPTRSGYTFLGWSTNPNSDNADSYPMGAIDKTITMSSDQTLYAIWWKWNFTLVKSTSISYMDQMTSTVCGNNTDTPTVGTYWDLQDRRDGNTYRVVKLEDKRCWMTDDLRLRLTTSGLTTTYSNINWNSSSAIKPANTLTINEIGTTLDDICKRNFFHDGITSGDLMCYYKVQSYVGDPGTGAGETGYYSWTAATAGGGGPLITSGDVDINSSICPKGWALPTGGENGEFSKLVNAIEKSDVVAGRNAKGNIIISSNPYNFIYTGTAYAGSIVYKNPDYKVGYWWSRTAASDINVYYMGTQYSSSEHYGGLIWVNPGKSTYHRYFGNAVRCIAK